MAQLISVKLARFDSSPWGFRLQGGKDFGTPLVIQKVTVGSLAEKAGLQAGDALIRVNDTELFNLRHKDAQDCLVRAGNSFELSVQRGGSTWKPAVTPIGPTPVPSSNIGKVQPVTKTSLAARQAPAPAIASGHNVSARPFAPQVNGSIASESVKSIVNKQYNSPVGMYSEETIAETLSAQAEVLAGGVLGVNFKKNEKNYNAANSEVFKMVQEIDKEPKEPEPEVVAAPSAAPLPVTGLRHVSAPAPSASTTTTPHEPLPPGQNICADCERLIVGVFVRIKDKNLHVECFKCATCGTSLKNVGYYNINNKLYCDIHAKLVARQNPPAPNLEPVTVPPGSRIPAGTISSALSSIRPSPLTTPSAPSPIRPLPAAAPLSPSSPQPGTLGPVPFHAPRIGTTHVNAPSPVQTPSGFGGPKPFASVPSPTPARPAPVASKVVWPPIKEDLSNDTPTATPLYIPPNPVPDPKNITSSSDMPSHTTSQQQFLINSKSQGTEYFKEGSFLQGEPEMVLKEGNLSCIKPMLNTVSVVSSTKQETVHFETQSTKNVVHQSNCGLKTEEKIVKNDEQMKKYSICSQEVVSCTENKLVGTQMLISNPRPTSPIPPESSDIASVPSQTNNEISFNKTEITSQNICENLYKKCTDEKDETNFSAINQLDTSCEESKQSVTTVNVDDMLNEKQSNELKIQNIRLPEATQSQNKEETICMLECKDEKFEHKVAMKESEIVECKTENVPIIDHSQNKQSVNIEKEIHSLHEEKITEKSKLYSLPIAQSVCEKPQKWQSALTSALTTAPERPFSPFDISKSQHLTIEGNQILQTSKYSSFASVSNDQTSSLPPQTIPCKPKLEIGLKGLTRSEGCPSPLVTALTIAPERPYSPFVNSENQIPESVLPLLPQPKQRISLLSALTIAPEREFMPFPTATKPSSLTFTDKTTFSVAQKPADSVKQSLNSSAQKSITSEIVNDPVNTDNTLSGNMPLHNFPPISDELKEKYSPNIIPGTSHKPKTPEASSATHAENLKSNQENIKDVSTWEVSEKSDKSITFVEQKAYSLTGIPKPATIPYYQKDIERYQIQRALSPATVCKRASPIQSNTNHSTHQPGPQDTVLKRPIPIKPPSVPLQETLVSTEFSKQNQPQHISDSGLGRPAIIPLYQQDLEQFQIQRALSPAPHFKVPGSRSPSPLPIDSDAAIRAYKFGAPLRPSSMHQEIPETGKITVTENEGKHISKTLCHDEQEHKKSLERISLQKTENMCKMETFSEKSKQENTSGLGGFATIPHYQKDLERYQVLRALSPAPHFKVPGSRSPSPAPINTESLKTAHKFEGSILPKDIHNMSLSMGQKNIQESLKEQISIFGSSESHEFSVLENQQYMLEEVALKNVSQSQPTKITTHGSIPFQPSSGQLKTIPYPNIPFPESGSNHYVTQNCKQETVKSNSNTDFILNTSSNQTQQFPEFIPKIPQLSSFSKASAPVKDPIASVKPQPNSTTIPNAGGGSGKATASVAGSSAPRRGRGVLNQPSTRIPLCGHCNGQIRGPFITALGKIWCPDHFVCVIPQCRRQLQDIGFVEEKGDLYCEFCFEQYIAPSCDKCTKKIRGDCLNAIGKHFHPECFLCAYCGKLFGNNPFFLEDGLPYCESDWNELFTTKCFACGFPIEAGDRWVEALNNNYHSQCFNCTNCKKNLEGQSFYAKGGRPFCKAHAR